VRRTDRSNGENTSHRNRVSYGPRRQPLCARVYVDRALTFSSWSFWRFSDGRSAAAAEGDADRFEDMARNDEKEGVRENATGELGGQKEAREA
jgi:hypothetical protein